tara:strand:+ start:36826 stop:37230 length:405 start_codon:yes stop_codon:yes gene_type:complete
MKNIKKQVLIVEDDILLLLVEERLVQKLGYKVIGTACEGDSALRKIKNYRPDIILMDINLKGCMKGTEVVEKMRLEGDDTPVIFLSGDREPQTIEKAKQMGCIDYLLKPITPSSLERSLMKAVEYSEQLNPQAA